MSVAVARIRWADRQLLVVRVGHRKREDTRLTRAEEEVARAAIGGLSNAEIATMRGRSERTIANQLASIFRKLGVTSRAELAAVLASARTRP